MKHLTATCWSLSDKVIACGINASLFVLEQLCMFLSISIGVGQDTRQA